MFLRTLICLSAFILTGADWVEISQQNYRKPIKHSIHPSSTELPEFKQETKKNRIYLNESIDFESNRGSVFKVPVIGKVEHVEKPVLDNQKRKVATAEKIEKKPENKYQNAINTHLSTLPAMKVASTTKITKTLEMIADRSKGSSKNRNITKHDQNTPKRMETKSAPEHLNKLVEIKQTPKRRIYIADLQRLNDFVESTQNATTSSQLPTTIKKSDKLKDSSGMDKQNTNQVDDEKKTMKPNERNGDDHKTLKITQPKNYPTRGQVKDETKQTRDKASWIHKEKNEIEKVDVEYKENFNAFLSSRRPANIKVEKQKFSPARRIMISSLEHSTKRYVTFPFESDQNILSSTIDYEELPNDSSSLQVIKMADQQNLPHNKGTVDINAKPIAASQNNNTDLTRNSEEKYIKLEQEYGERKIKKTKIPPAESEVIIYEDEYEYPKRRIDLSFKDEEMPEFVTKQDFTFSNDDHNNHFIIIDDDPDCKPHENKPKDAIPNIESVAAFNDDTKMDTKNKTEDITPKETINPLENLIKFMKIVADTISKNTRSSVKSKTRYLEHLRDTIMANIEERIEATWPDDDPAGGGGSGGTMGQGNLRGKREARGHVEFPSSEGALMTISFLTFAVFLVKLILQVIHTYQNKTMMVTPAVVAMGRAAAALANKSRV